MSEIDLGSDICVELIDGETYLLHGVSVTYRDLTVGFGVEVIGYAERSSDLVLAAISLADGAGVVEIDAVLFTESLADFPRLV